MVCTGQEWFVRDRNGLYAGLAWSVQDWVGQFGIGWSVRVRNGLYGTGLVSTGQGWSVQLSVGQCSKYRRGGQVWFLWDRLVGKGQVGQYGRGLVSLEES